MPSDLERSGFLINYKIANPESKLGEIVAPVTKQFPHTRLSLLLPHGSIPSLVFKHYQEASGVTIDPTYYATHQEFDQLLVGGTHRISPS
ncbi:MAG: hypothetical protein J6386_26050 [Candidatus Synoicihabitans palmerolidicus]|nr:hypothetical protein [Candidatus Synoicihabitans palmerolidicus]MCC5025744.1 hypothetical protein [Candidatus Synoicihabitans palmerolidicus]MCC5025886.1 hypothetical protein [Candidatus Synoicihabitans palmerolidicus]MCC5025927.1 hypothetical protein [Candidatus Synoicihabitans palmerolidicus]MCC5025966.1 hypothetical protein [Candidatus Synoicihabitans palmerolidicus]